MNYIFRKETFGGLLYDVSDNKLYLTCENVHTKEGLKPIYFLPMNQGDPSLLSNNYFYEKCCKFINSPILNTLITAPTTVFFEVIKRCNLRCNHCFNSSGKIENEELGIGEIDSIISNLASIGVFNVKISGGEPFCRADIFEILHIFERHSINFTIFTNGILISDDVATKRGVQALAKS